MPYGRPKPKPPVRVPPGAAVTAAEFADLPFGGHAGEWLSGGQTAPAPPPQPLVIEPPPWAGEETGPIVPLAAPASASAAQPTAPEVMRADDGDGEWRRRPACPWRWSRCCRSRSLQSTGEPSRRSVLAWRPVMRKMRSKVKISPIRRHVAPRNAHGGREGPSTGVLPIISAIRAPPGGSRRRPQPHTFASRIPRFRSTAITITARSARSCSSHGTVATCGLSEVSDDVADAINVRVGDRTVAVPNRLYWSASRIGGVDDGLALNWVSLTASPASVDPRPVTFLDGRLDHRQAAQRWRSRLDRVEFTLLDRAANARASRRRGDPIMIDELADPRATKLARSQLWIDERTGEPLGTTSLRSAAPSEYRPPGKLRMRPCTILRVSRSSAPVHRPCPRPRHAAWVCRNVS